LSLEGYSIRPARTADAPILAAIMVEEIHWGRLSGLGQRFITLLHDHMIASAHVICRVAEHDGEILGYAAVATDTSKFYREFLRRRGLQATILVLPKIFRPRLLRVVLRGLTYFPAAHADDPRAEVLSVAVRSTAKQSGLGRAIMQAVADEFRAHGITAIKIGTVAVTNTAANTFYCRIGCELIRTVPFYKDTEVNVYVYRLQQ
jgi:ribosomal protein S18 acetylase RimI-like enzyme